MQNTENNPSAQESGAQQPVIEVFHNDHTGHKFQTNKTDYSAVLNMGKLLSVSCGLQLQFC